MNRCPNCGRFCRELTHEFSVGPTFECRKCNLIFGFTWTYTAVKWH